MAWMIARDESSYLAHHGIKGQKWGIRRYQNEDGTLTAEGRKHYGLDELDRKNKIYNPSGLNDRKKYDMYKKEKEQLNKYYEKQYNKMLLDQGITEDEYTDWLIGDWGYNSKEYKEATKKIEPFHEAGMKAKEEIDKYLNDKYKVKELEKRMHDKQKRKEAVGLVATSLAVVGMAGAAVAVGMMKG